MDVFNGGDGTLLMKVVNPTHRERDAPATPGMKM